jgi:hypothetical protein
MPTVIEIPFPRRANGATVEIPEMNLSARADETRRAVSDGADSLGAAANDFGREAIRLGRDAMRLGREAARRGLLMATSGEKALRRASNDAAATIEDLRSYQIVRKRRGPDWRPGLALISGASAGLAAMYFLDPEQGRRRRVLFMDQVNKYTRVSTKWLDATVRDLRNRSEGIAIEARKAMDQARSGADGASTYGAEGVMATPDRSDELAATDWPAEPATSEPYRS